MRMPAIVIRDHGNRDVANLGFAGQLRLLQVGHTDHVHAQAAIDIRLGLCRKLRTLHTQIGSAELARYSGLAASLLHDASKFPANRIAEGNVRDNPVAKKSINPVTRAVEELIGNDEIERLVLFLQRSDGRNGDDPLDAQLFEAVNVSAKIQLAGQNVMAASVAGEECNLPAFQRAADVSVGGRTERRLYAHFLHLT